MKMRNKHNLEETLFGGAEKKRVFLINEFMRLIRIYCSQLIFLNKKKINPKRWSHYVDITNNFLHEKSNNNSHMPPKK